MRRMILVPLLVVLAVLAIGGGVGYYFYNNYMFYHTDDAQVSGNIVSITAPQSGSLTTLNAKLGATVNAGDAIATLTVNTNGTNTTQNITSPITGTIVAVPTVQGQSVVPGLALAQVTNLSNITITAYVDESAIDNVKLGQDVDVVVDAFSDTTLKGHVNQIVSATAGSFSLLPTQDNASGNFTKVSQRIPVIVTIDGTSGKNIVPGMNATITIHVH